MIQRMSNVIHVMMNAKHAMGVVIKLALVAKHIIILKILNVMNVMKIVKIVYHHQQILVHHGL